MLTKPPEPARIERLTVKRFRALRDLSLTNLTPLTALLGPNGSGKSTVFDVFAFLAEIFETGLRPAWERRGRARKLKTRGEDGPVEIEIAYRERPRTPLITWHLEVEEDRGRPVVKREWLRWKRRRYGRPFRFLDHAAGKGTVVSGEAPDETDTRIDVPLSSPDTLSVNALGQLAENPRVVALRTFITGWHLSYLSSDDARRARPEDPFGQTEGDLAALVRRLAEDHPERLDSICRRLRERIPGIENVTADSLSDGRLSLWIGDRPLPGPFRARYASRGTLRLLASLVLILDPSPPPFIGIGEPENSLHPRLLHGLAEDCRVATAATQILVTTHSPLFLDALRPGEVRVLWRDASGHTRCHPLAGNEKVTAFMEEGALLGDLWMEGHFGVGDPLTRSGMPAPRTGCR